MKVKVNGMFVSRVRREPGKCPYQGKKESLVEDWIYLNLDGGELRLREEGKGVGK